MFYLLCFDFIQYFLNKGRVRVDNTNPIVGTIEFMNGFGNFAK